MTFEFIIPTYSRIHPLKSILSSLMAQTDDEWRAVVGLDYPEIGMRAKLIDVITSFHDDRISYFVTDRRYNDWGHSLREIAKQKSVADYLILTGDDCYYAPTFIKELKFYSSTLPGVIYWDMVHSHYDYQYFRCLPAYNQIDMGAFATRRDVAQKIPLNTSYAAD